MKVKLLVGALLVLVLINIAALGSFWFLHAHGRHHGDRRYDREHRSHRFANVSEDERQKLFRAMKSFHEDVKPLSDATAKLEDDVVASMRKDPVPRAHIDSLLEQISKNRLELARRATDRMIAMGDSLSADERGHMVDALMRFRHGRDPIPRRFREKDKD
jgi:hypothetical protein